MHIVLLILKILLIVVLSVLGLLLCLLLLVLLAPVRYRGYARWRGDAHAKFTARWLGFVLCFSAVYDEDGPGYRLRLFGGTLKSGGLPIGKKESDRDEADEDLGESDAAKSGGTTADSDGTGATKSGETSADSGKSDSPASRTAEDSGRRFADGHPDMDDGDREFLLADDEFDDSESEKKTGFWMRLGGGIDRLAESVSGRIRSFADRIIRLRDRIFELRAKKDRYVKLLGNARTKEAYRVIKRELFRFLCHIRPTRLDGEIIYGTGDPASTGQHYGYMCALFYPVFADTIRLVPDFDEKRLEGEIFLAGRIRLGTVCMILLRVIINKNCRITYSRLKKISGVP